ncbi:MAG: hypothetical protein GKR89_35775 [Candidatus Latescibacteria bacterium]|nr:hypothetical protein [Candidatus Latescibacterota bacterium]
MDDKIASAPRLLLNGEWEFVEGGDGDRPTDGWQRLRVPHRSREFEDEPPVAGWYRTQLEVPGDWDWAGGRLILDLGRVRHYGRAYLDGQALGDNYGMRRAWRLDLSAAVVAGGTYELMVFTHNCTGPYVHPHTKALSEDAEKALDTRFWFTSAPTIGMEDDIWVELEPAVRLTDIYLVTSVRQRIIAVEAAVVNDGGRAFSGTAKWRVRLGGAVELELPAVAVAVEPGQRQTVQLQADWENPVLWGRPPYGEPVLYHLEGELRGAEGCRHRSETRFGFREIWAEGDQLLLNGEKLMPWGDHTVPYVYERQWLTRKFAELAAANISIVEHHRYDPPPVFYEVADEMGVFVVGANFCVGTGQVPPADMDAAEFELVMANHLEVADQWIRRSRNHPSILFWDITDARSPAFCVPLLRKVKELDPTRIAEVTFDPGEANAKLVELIDCYRLFSGLEHIEASIEKVRDPARFPVKPVRVGEAGIFDGAFWEADQEPPLQAGWWDFLVRLPQRNIHGLQTFHLADMDYRGFKAQVPNNLSQPLQVQIHWPAQSGRDARIDPAALGTQAGWGKTELYLNWCDPDQPVARPTATHHWSRALFRRWTGCDVGPLAGQRAPEVMVQAVRGGQPLAGALVFVEALEDRSMRPWGVRADAGGYSWFVLERPGHYRFSCQGSGGEIEALCQPVQAPAGYDHIQQLVLNLEEET